MALSFTFDKELQLKDAGLIAADAAWQVGGSAKILDLGATNALFTGVLVVDVSAIEIASNDELYHLIVQGSNASNFGSGVENLAALSLGATEVRPGAGPDSAIGRFLLPFYNTVDGLNHFRYIRGYADVAGTIATGINFTAWIGRSNIVG